MIEAKEYASNLVDEFRLILQDEDTDCGQEILCTLIAKKCATICIERILEYKSGDVSFFNDVKTEINKI